MMEPIGKRRFADFPDIDTINNDTQSKKKKTKSKEKKVKKANKPVKKVKEKCPKFSEAEKIQLAGLVEQQPCIWKLSHPLHSNIVALQSAWEVIGSVMQTTPKRCKTGWKSITDAIRYRKNPKEKQKKSGSGRDALQEDPSGVSDLDTTKIIEGWTMWPHVKFLEESKPKRLAIETPVNTIDVTDESSSSDSDDEVGYNSECNSDNERDPCSSQSLNSTMIGTKDKIGNKISPIYDYLDKGKKLTGNKSDDDGTSKLLDGLNSFLDIRKKQIESQPSEQSGLKYVSMWSNLERMFRKLPEEKIEDLNMEFINMTYIEVKKMEGWTVNVVEANDDE